jgi:thiol-disulfide isomerase/thioredoxin
MATQTTSGMARLRIWGALLALTAVIALVSGCSKFEKAHNGPQASAKFFDAKFTDVNGKIVDLSTLRGKTVVVNVWSTWCPPCVEEMPMFSDVQTQWKNKNVVFVGIAADQADNVKVFLKKTPVNYLIAVGGQPSFDLSRDLGNRYDAVPFTLMINPQENITSRHFGVYTRKDLEADLAKAAVN